MILHLGSIDTSELSHNHLSCLLIKRQPGYYLIRSHILILQIFIAWIFSLFSFCRLRFTGLTFIILAASCKRQDHCQNQHKADHSESFFVLIFHVLFLNHIKFQDNALTFIPTTGICQSISCR